MIETALGCKVHWFPLKLGDLAILALIIAPCLNSRQAKQSISDLEEKNLQKKNITPSIIVLPTALLQLDDFVVCRTSGNIFWMF